MLKRAFSIIIPFERNVFPLFVSMNKFKLIGKVKGKGKGSAVTIYAWTGTEGSRTLRLPHLKKVGT
jgi:hypothetical protein